MIRTVVQPLPATALVINANEEKVNGVLDEFEKIND